VVSEILGASRRSGVVDALSPRKRKVLDPPPSDTDHRRVPAVLGFLET
jgi:hypothetical protein